MSAFAKPVVLVSKCLGFAVCRWNGVTISAPFVERLKPHVEFKPVCPEVEIGLGVPRKPIRVVEQRGERRLIQPETGRDMTKLMTSFAAKHLDGLGEIHGVLLKGRSPSCGIKDVKLYPAPESATPTGKGTGFFGAAVMERHADLPIEDEGRLTNEKIREQFLTRLFAIAAFERMARKPRMASLVEFHARNKLLIRAYSQKALRMLGRIVANPEHRPVEELLADYRPVFRSAFARPVRTGAITDVLMHALGYFSKGLTSREKAHFLDSLESYREGRLPLSALQSILRSWIARFNEEYLEGQTFFAPYPEALADLSDSGKGKTDG
jgi:uncharacterized protein YbgA (DUF1722 family)/uncharacterized protein YbbK (DUF523 family)